MKLLAWDTSTVTGTLVAAEWDATAKDSRATLRVVAEWQLSLDTAVHSERLLWAIHQILAACGWDPSAIDVYGVGVGPGSFTGLRIGITTARQFAHTLGRPLVPVSSLALLARPAARMMSEVNALLCATRPSARGEVFAL
jgi:tRNA threonylcarbamoyladenosine biosynthesis protein TsaB